MKIRADRLKKIIIEEYIKEELLDESQAAEDLLRQLIGDEEYNRRRALDNPDSPGAEGRPQMGFKLEELQELIRRVFKDV